MVSDTLAGLLTSCDADYARKMLHAVPDAPVVDRIAFVAARCRGRRVLSLGHSGPLAAVVDDVAAEVYGVDRSPLNPDVQRMDLDRWPEHLPPWPVDLVLCGEVLEHLANPGRLLEHLALAYHNIPVIITVPNAMSQAARRHMERGVENINRDHVAWYSYYTLLTLVERYGYELQEWYWYNGTPRFAEGLIFVVR